MARRQDIDPESIGKIRKYLSLKIFGFNARTALPLQVVVCMADGSIR
jgi:hypothetical protein